MGGISSIREKMKLLGFLVASAAANEAANEDSTGDLAPRAFSDNNKFLSASDASWWNANAAVAQFQDLVEGGDAYFGNYWKASGRSEAVSGRLNTLLENARNQMQEMAYDCPNDDAGRKKREIGERWEFPDNPQNGFMQLFWAHARWAREEINAAAGKNCAKKRERIFKKLDRLRAITAWQYCDKVDSGISFCKWAHGINKKTGQPKTNPRHMKWLDKKYGMNEGKNSQ